MNIEITYYNTIDKGALKAFFSFIVNEQEICDCSYFVSGENRWFNFPQKEIKYTDGRKSTYKSLVRFKNKSYEDQLKEAVLKELKSRESNAEKTNKTNDRKKDQVQTESSFGWDKPPF